MPYSIKLYFCYFSLELPRCENPKKESTIINGTNIFLTCVARGNPPPTVRWQKILPSKTSLGSRFSASQEGLQIKRALLSDSGTYQVTLTNSLGSVETLSSSSSCDPQSHLKSLFSSSSTHQSKYLSGCHATGNKSSYNDL